MPSPREEMQIVARRLQPLAIDHAFVGGAVMFLLVDQPELTEFRRTKDVDVVVEIVTYGEFAALEDKLRLAGFAHDQSIGAPMIRWVVEGCKVDIMPKDSGAVGMNVRWFPDVLRLAESKDLGGGITAKVVSPAMFIATKYEAYNDRGKGDVHMSHDLEDIVTLVDGRKNIVDEVDGLKSSAPGAREFIIGETKKLLGNPYFEEAMAGHLPRMAGARERVPMVLAKFRGMAQL
jgi:predicted nucleotidyltransferase